MRPEALPRTMLWARARAVGGGAAALVGGAAWSVKAAAILLTGSQPPIVFALGPPLFALGLIGLHGRVDGRARPARAGLVLAWTSLLLLGLVAVVALARPDLVPRGEEFTPVGGLLLAAMLAQLAALALLGRVAQTQRALPGRWRHLPLALAVGTPVGVAAGGVASGANERLLEVPILVIGLAWMLLGALIVATYSRNAREPAGAMR